MWLNNKFVGWKSRETVPLKVPSSSDSTRGVACTGVSYIYCVLCRGALITSAVSATTEPKLPTIFLYSTVVSAVSSKIRGPGTSCVSPYKQSASLRVRGGGGLPLRYDTHLPYRIFISKRHKFKTMSKFKKKKTVNKSYIGKLVSSVRCQCRYDKNGTLCFVNSTLSRYH